MVKKIFGSSLAVSAVTLLLTATNSMAAITLPTSVDVSQIESWYALLLPALVVMFGIRKITKTTNRT